MAARPRVIVVVPAWNEAPRIARVLGAMPPLVDSILVVDDASTDGTAQRAREAGDARVEVLEHPHNRGVGAAIATGYRRALAIPGNRRDVFVVMAGDGQMDPRDLPTLVAEHARSGADYVKGDRFCWAGGARAMPAARRLGGRVFSWATTHAIGVAISDSQCGYTSIAREACAKLDLDALWPRYGYPNDLLSQLATRRLRIAEVPVRAVYCDEVSRLTARHLPAIAAIIGRAGLRRVSARLASRPERAVDDSGNVGEGVVEIE